MSRIRKLAVAGGTFGVALSIGFVMQNGDAMAARFGTDVPAIEGDDIAGPVSPPVETPPAMAGLSEDPGFVDPADEDSVEPEALATAAPDQAGVLADPVIRFLSAPSTDVVPPVATEPEAELQDVAAEVRVLPLTPLLTGFPGPLEVASMVTGFTREVADLLPTPAVAAATPQADRCEAALDAAVGRAALVTLTLSAPCQPETQVTLHHQGMMFTLTTDGDGRAEAEVPALDVAAIFIASFPDGAGAVAAAEVPALANFDRAVLQWQGEAALQLHAREFGAGYGEAGHVWLASARAADEAIAGEGGFLTRLGDGTGPAPLFAEVYTFPTAAIRRGGDVVLTVEAEITEATCGREVTAQSIQIRPDAAPKALDLTMTLPGCDAVGDFVVLNTMLEDLTLAAR